MKKFITLTAVAALAVSTSTAAVAQSGTESGMGGASTKLSAMSATVTPGMAAAIIGGAIVLGIALGGKDSDSDDDSSATTSSSTN
ncbi:hypothetical protein [Donghicola sp. XS_ASV15]|uniref:hypothetical protein n=1 Tax=Donghicola sp. XS_ASV15 TaxID=3241295 RepID=UPI0035123058